MQNALALADGDPAARAAQGFGDGREDSMFAYGLSKACLNAYALALARLRPDLQVNSCTPGFIETDLTRRMAERAGRTPADMGMKEPAHGAQVPVRLVLGDVEGSGRYYGSDGLRSPLDCYRAPGDPPYEGP
mmetsp:Transcript_18598/g.62349  ORF Transcript_18598/g.62349 Transcript_18598/m.62349 type:complete len:132 (-) Transcript_18598:33-428(-)